MCWAPLLHLPMWEHSCPTPKAFLLRTDRVGHPLPSRTHHYFSSSTEPTSLFKVFICTHATFRGQFSIPLGKGLYVTHHLPPDTRSTVTAGHKDIIQIFQLFSGVREPTKLCGLEENQIVTHGKGVRSRVCSPERVGATEQQKLTL